MDGWMDGRKATPMTSIFALPLLCFIATKIRTVSLFSIGIHIDMFYVVSCSACSAALLHLALIVQTGKTDVGGMQANRMQPVGHENFSVALAVRRHALPLT